MGPEVAPRIISRLRIRRHREPAAGQPQLRDEDRIHLEVDDHDRRRETLGRRKTGFGKFFRPVEPIEPLICPNNFSTFLNCTCIYRTTSYLPISTSTLNLQFARIDFILHVAFWSEAGVHMEVSI